LGTSTRVALTYAICWPGAVISGMVGSTAILALTDAANVRATSEWGAMAFYVMPALIVGASFYFWLSCTDAARPAPGVTLRSHWVRALPLYLLAGILGGVVQRRLSDTDFGLYGQLLIWPLSSTLGGVLGDAAAVMMASRAQSRQAAI
jgi:hypothetical protein